MLKKWCCSHLKRRAHKKTMYWELLSDIRRLRICCLETDGAFDEKEDETTKDIPERDDKRCKDTSCYLKKLHLEEGNEEKASRDLQELVEAYRTWASDCDSLDVKERQRRRINFLEDILVPTGYIFGKDEPLR
jgi:hypothetical protein